MSKYRKKPVIIEAIELKYSTDSQEECIAFTCGLARKGCDGSVIIPTSEGDMRANTGDYIIKEPFDKDRKFYPCKPDIFELTYEAVNDQL